MEKSKPNFFWAVSNFLGRSTHTVNAHSKIATERTAIETQQSTKTKQVGAVEVTTQRYCAGVKIQGSRAGESLRSLLHTYYRMQHDPISFVVQG